MYDPRFLCKFNAYISLPISDRAYQRLSISHASALSIRLTNVRRIKLPPPSIFVEFIYQIEAIFSPFTSFILCNFLPFSNTPAHMS